MNLFTPPVQILKQHIQSNSQIVDYWHEMIGTANVDTTGKNTVVYVLDTAEEWLADDLPKQGNKWAYNATGRTNDPGNHGHMVASMIAASNNEYGSLGVATDAIIIPVKALHINTGSWTWAIDGLDYIIKNYNENFKDTYVGFINMSFGGSQEYIPLKNKLEEAVNNGLVPIAAAGNGGGSIDYPGAWDDLCITTTAIDRNFNPDPFTDRGQAADVAAAGVSVVTVMPNNTYPRANGTSFACPIVAGVCCHIGEKYSSELLGKKEQTFKLIQDHLKNFATDFGVPGEDELGAGYTIIKPYLDNKFTDTPDEEEPEYPEKEERVLTFDFTEDFKIRWGTSIGFTQQLTNADLMPSASQWLYVDNMKLSIRTNLFAEKAYLQTLEALTNYFRNRGLILFKNSDLNDAAYWTHRFMKIIIKDIDFVNCSMIVSDDNGTKLIWNEDNT